MSGIRRVAKYNVLPQPTVVSKVISVEPALIIRELQELGSSAAALERTVIRNEGWGHIHEIGPRKSVSLCIVLFRGL